MTEMAFRVGALTVTAYGLYTLAAAITFAGLTYAIARFVLQKSASGVAALFAVIIPAGLLGARIVYCAVNFDRYLADGQGLLRALCVWEGGLSLAGAMLFGATALRLYAGSNDAFWRALDLLTPGAMLFIAVIRWGEGATPQGVGKSVDTEFLRGGPFVMTDAYGDVRHAVYRWETLAALILCALAIYLLLQRRRRGGAAKLSWMVFCACGVILESLRDDDYLKFQYVRVSQAMYFIALLVLAGFFVASGFRAVHHLRGAAMPFSGVGGWTALLVLAVLGAALTVYQEFRVDTDVNLELNYLIMAVGLGAIVFSAWRCDAFYRAARAKARADRMKRRKTSGRDKAM